eukprot:scaffold85863_cov30-Cyclotella_meneghiniana.AAC.1
MLAANKTAKIWEPARECIHKAAVASWWEWVEGSRPFFWLWKPYAQKWALDGQPHYQVKKLPTFTKPQKAPKSDEDRIKVWRKVFPVRQRRYIDEGFVKNRHRHNSPTMAIRF